MDCVTFIKKKIKFFGIDGYIVPKNDEYFSEHSNPDRLKIVSNFTGSAGYAVILKKKSFLFVDGRYTIQAKIESGKNFKIVDYEKIINEFALLSNKWLGITKGLDQKQWQITNIVKLRVAGMEDASI